MPTDMSNNFSHLTIREIIKETPKAVSLVFEIPKENKASYLFQSGQYVSIEKDHIRRAYSISSAPFEGLLKITVKKVKGGQMSPYLVDELAVGDQLKVSTPEGDFVMHWEDHLVRKHYFVAAGSGITPVISLIKDGLEKEPKSIFILLYGSRNPDDIIFRKELNDLQEKYKDQLFVRHTLSQSDAEKTGVFSIFKKKPKRELWTGDKGRISIDKLKQLFMEHPIGEKDNHFFLCGPGDMIQNLNSFLGDLEIKKQNIHKEYFTNPDEDSSIQIVKKAARLKARNLHGQDVEVNIAAGKTLLEALQDENQDPPYSCMNGVCSSCMAKKVSGELKMESALALDDDELEEGYILTCQAFPLSDEVVIQYED
jgi:ring-1,2-phenylacetyl-CoA epoxidase subunit PaaE